MKARSIAAVFVFVCTLALSLRSPIHAAEAKPEYVQLKYTEAEEMVKIVKKHLGADVAAAILSAEPRTNRVVIDSAHPHAKAARELVERLDTAKPAVKVSAVVKRVSPATAADPKAAEVIGKPQIIGPFDTPMKLIISDGEKGTIEVELTVTQLEAKQ